MNRQQRRKQQRILKSKLTDEQFEQLHSASMKEAMDKGKERTTEIITDALQATLADKKFRISQQRQNAIIEGFMERLENRGN